MAEIELILATTTALGRICPKNAFTVRINDRGILKGMALYCGFPEDGLDQVFITLDKMDKIGLDGVKAELLELGYAAESVEKYAELLSGLGEDAAAVRGLGETLAGVLDTKTAENLANIMDTVTEVAETDFKLAFDPTLVRGMSYYTGTIFEVSMEGFGGSVAGGGRYDKMIGKFTGQDTPACGFSIGFRYHPYGAGRRNRKCGSEEGLSYREGHGSGTLRTDHEAGYGRAQSRCPGACFHDEQE